MKECLLLSRFFFSLILSSLSMFLSLSLFVSYYIHLLRLSHSVSTAHHFPFALYFYLIILLQKKGKRNEESNFFPVTESGMMMHFRKKGKSDSLIKLQEETSLLLMQWIHTLEAEIGETVWEKKLVRRGEKEVNGRKERGEYSEILRRNNRVKSIS